jgi:outer membrane protein assembly factor BamB
LFVGTHGQVRALDKSTGRQVWNTDLPNSWNQLVTLLYEDGVLFAGVYGRVHALDAATGRKLWSNDLPGLSYNFITLATERSSTSVAERAAELEAERSSGGGD